jgi:DNA (cytosine-5)-methyltransferase 1
MCPNLRVGSLFSGIGGMDLGLQTAGGYEITWQVEKDPWCRRVLAKHWPDVPRYEDVTTLTGEELAPVDLVCGGFPCQPVSYAGKQKGTDDDRWLWPHFARLLGILRPPFALLENVPGLFTANGGHAFGEVIGDLADLGYDCEWSVLSAADVGAPHLRKRVWIIGIMAHAHGERWRVRRNRQRDRDADQALGRGEEVADADRTGLEGRKLLPQRATERTAGETGLDDRRIFAGPIRGTWEPEPDVGRVAHGVPQRVDRLRGLGNSVVPQVVTWIGKQIQERHTVTQ